MNTFFFIIFYLIIFSTVNSTLTGNGPAGSSEGQQNVQNVGQNVDNQNVQQIHPNPQFYVDNVQWDPNAHSTMLDDAQFMNAFLEMGSAEGNYGIHSHPLNPPQNVLPHSTNPYLDAHFHQQSLQSFQPEQHPQSANTHLWQPQEYSSSDQSNSNPSGQNPFEGHENEDWGDEDFLVDYGIEEEDVANGKRLARNEREKRRRGEFEKKMCTLRNVYSEKCGSFPILEEMVRAHHKGLLLDKRKSYVLKGSWKETFTITHQCILVMEKWLIDISEIIEMEKQQGKEKIVELETFSVDNKPKISIAELISNARQNQQILEKHPLLFVDRRKAAILLNRRAKRMMNIDKSEAEKAKEQRMKQVVNEAKRRATINEELRTLFSTLPKEFVISRMNNFSKETLLDTIKKYVEFLSDMLHPFMVQIWELAGKQNGQKSMKMQDWESGMNKRQKIGN